ncbi:hypothetical protein OAT84_04290 [Gammaproteobacteria bacterium]|nr:hypothetical protein [Gammaproteobacteria bacterium]
MKQPNELIKLNQVALDPMDFRKPFSKEGKDGKEGKDDICAMVDHGIWE